MGQHYVNLHNLQMRDRIIIAREDEYQPKPGNGKFLVGIGWDVKKRLRKTVGIREGS
jgi:hypothetical protein